MSERCTEHGPHSDDGCYDCALVTITVLTEALRKVKEHLEYCGSYCTFTPRLIDKALTNLPETAAAAHITETPFETELIESRAKAWQERDGWRERAEKAEAERDEANTYAAMLSALFDQYRGRWIDKHEGYIRDRPAAVAACIAQDKANLADAQEYRNMKAGWAADAENAEAAFRAQLDEGYGRP